eukprot:CAMPEP_0113936544 /NCGR_PEP_ID=MMETSP1339-20121228/3441_1 /TAXON_ID=94617 /ORGANISM="Fibrocapsa japonica" /LENGTH=513 /DNA_ID=CAMNT_0000939063 /DNA_START=102 /DNA_END=1643 /DNA_ORIENTATION=+ /assembly_acc=CAM_ASM_000762
MAEEVRTLWIGDIQPNWDEAYVNALFAQTGHHTEVKLIRDKITGFPAGYGFVDFPSHAVAQEVLAQLNGQPIPGTPFRYRLNWGAGGNRQRSDGQGGFTATGTSGGPEYSLFVGDLTSDVTDLLLQTTFSVRFPSTLGAKVVTDQVTAVSKGYGFVRFSSEEERNQALNTMTGALCGSKPIRVAMATKKMDKAPYSTYSTPTSTEENDDPNNTTVFVGGIDTNTTEESLRQHFAVFGEIVYVKIPPGRGCGFVSFAHRIQAEAALMALNGTELDGTRLRLSWGRSSSKPPVGAAGVANPMAAYTAAAAGAYPGAAAAAAAMAAYPGYQQAAAMQAAYAAYPGYMAAYPQQAAAYAAAYPQATAAYQGYPGYGQAGQEDAHNAAAAAAAAAQYSQASAVATTAAAATQHQQHYQQHQATPAVVTPQKPAGTKDNPVAIDVGSSSAPAPAPAPAPAKKLTLMDLIGPVEACSINKEYLQGKTMPVGAKNVALGKCPATLPDDIKSNTAMAFFRKV